MGDKCRIKVHSKLFYAMKRKYSSDTCIYDIKDNKYSGYWK